MYLAAQTRRLVSIHGVARSRQIRIGPSGHVGRAALDGILILWEGFSLGADDRTFQRFGSWLRTARYPEFAESLTGPNALVWKLDGQARQAEHSLEAIGRTDAVGAPTRLAPHLLSHASLGHVLSVRERAGNATWSSTTSSPARSALPRCEHTHLPQVASSRPSVVAGGVTPEGCGAPAGSAGSGRTSGS